THAHANRGDLAGTVGNRDARQRLAGPVASLDHHEVAVVQRSRAHPHEHLSRSGLRVGKLDEFEILQPETSHDLKCLHRASPSYRGRRAALWRFRRNTARAPYPNHSRPIGAPLAFARMTAIAMELRRFCREPLAPSPLCAPGPHPPAES